ncbi:SprB repeat-containing protein, partial [Flavobacterium undicola]|uniref:SprB repeat-containing protein n=1 Tax=Flavobacterium undicola TaxID=1932779 RepID=UPI0015E24517
METKITQPFWIIFLLFVILPFSAVGQCPSNYVTNLAAKTIKFQFEAGNGAADGNVACDFVRVHGGTGTDPCSGGSITVAGVTYNYTGNTGGGSSAPIILTYTTTQTLNTVPSNIEIAKAIGCGQIPDDNCFEIYFQDIETGQNCNSSNSKFSMTIKDNGCGPYTLQSSGNSALTFPTSGITTGTYTTSTIKAGIYILIFKDKFSKEHVIIYNHITEVGTCVKQSNLDIVKTITSGNPYYSAGNIITYSYSVTSDAPITAPFVNDDHIVGNITTHTGDTNNDGILQVGETWKFTASYTVTQADIESGSVTNLAFARGSDVNNLPIFSDVDDATALLTTCVASAGSDVTINCTNTSAQLLATGGASYSWSPSTGLSAINIANPIATPPTTTTYTVTATTANGCTATDQVVVTVNKIAPTASIISQTNVSCFGNTNGSVTVAGSNGTSPYTYAKDGITFGSSGTFSNLAAGSYTITVKDANGCTTTQGVTISQPDALSATVAKTNVTCNAAADGTITVSAPLGGYGTFEYRLNNGTWQTSGSFNALAPATYSVQIRDKANPNCVIVLGDQTISQPDALSATVAKTNVTCNAAADGTITVSAPLGGYGTFEYR